MLGNINWIRGRGRTPGRGAHAHAARIVSTGARRAPVETIAIVATGARRAPEQTIRAGMGDSG